MGSASTDPCVHCGFCLPTCASYRVLGTEMDSPRGRIHTLKAIGNGELELDQQIAYHFDTCLGCLACVSACPSGVRYDELIATTRPRLNVQELRSPWQRSFRKLLFSLLPYPNRLKPILAVLRIYGGSGLQGWMRHNRLLRVLRPELQAMERLLPELPQSTEADQFPEVVAAKGPKRGRVALVLGCVQRVFDPDVNQATVDVLSANGFEVVIPREQGCCGAVTHHQGELEQTKDLARDLVRAFNTSKPVDAILIAASGCGHTLKQYAQILDEKRSGPFRAPVKDVHEFLSEVGFAPTFTKSLKPLIHPDGSVACAEQPVSVAFHDACHMIHGQGIESEPRGLLRAIPHLSLREVMDSGVCCGSAGIYNLIQPEVANELGCMKVADLEQTGAHLVASSNIGCTLQIKSIASASSVKLKVLHPMQILRMSYNSSLGEARGITGQNNANADSHSND